MNINFISFGCKVNQYETQCLREDFENHGYTVTNSPMEADVFVINSCTVTASSDNKVMQCIKKLRHQHTDSLIVLTGCYPQAFSEEAKKITEADVITGTKNRKELVKLVEEAIEKKHKSSGISRYQGNELIEDISCTHFSDKTRAFMKIQDGCNQFCSYCIIPFARGRIRSKPIERVRVEAKEFAEKGHKEIVLIGINLAFYGKEYGIRLVDAIEECDKIDGIERIRLGSLEPEMILNDDLKRLAGIKKFCPHFHLSLQSGSDKILKKMNRQYTSEQYLQLVKQIRSTFPDCSITTDIMVGFPDETEDDFKQSLEFIKQIGFAKVHIFPYSVRTGTAAAKMSNQISDNIKTERARLMSEAAGECSAKFLESQVGKVYPVLFEKENCTNFHRGHCPNYTLVKIPSKSGEKSLRHEIFCVKIIGCENNYCIGRII